MGYSEPSDLLIVRTLPSNIFVPNRPYIVVNDGSNLEIGWKSNQLIEKDVFYVVEGSNGAGEIDDEWSIIYKGTSNSLMIKNYNLCAFRVATCKNNLQVCFSYHFFTVGFSLKICLKYPTIKLVFDLIIFFSIFGEIIFESFFESFC